MIASGGYGNVYFLSTNAMGSNVSAAWKIHKKGAYFANPCFVQIHPTCIPVHGTQQSKLTLMSESLRNSGRIWVPKKLEDAQAIREGKLRPESIKEEDRDYYLVTGEIESQYRDWETDRKSTRLNSSHRSLSRMPSSA